MIGLSKVRNSCMDVFIFKTKNNKIWDRKNHFGNHPCGNNTFSIILSPPKNFATFVRQKSIDKFRQKKIKNQQNLDQEKSKILLPTTKCCQEKSKILFLNRHAVNQEKSNILCPTATNSSLLSHIHTSTHTQVPSYP